MEIFREITPHFSRAQLAGLRDAIVSNDSRLTHKPILTVSLPTGHIEGAWLLPYMLWDKSTPWLGVDALAEMRETEKLIADHSGSAKHSPWQDLKHWWCTNNSFARSACRQDVLSVLHQLIGDSEMDAKQEIEQAVNQPSHYCRDGIEVIDVIAAFTSPEKMQGFCHGNAIKYLLRAEHKGDFRKDLLKARNYLERLIELTDPENSREADGFRS